MRHLRQLVVSCSDSPAAELQQLSSLSSLTDISLSCKGDNSANEFSNAAAGFEAIGHKIQHFELVTFQHDVQAVPFTALQQISCLTAVSSLRVCMCEGPMRATADQLAGILQNLKQLVRLEIYNDVTEAPLVQMDEAAMAALAQQAAAAAQAGEAALQGAFAAAAAAAAVGWGAAGDAEAAPALPEAPAEPAAALAAVNNNNQSL
jgi:hypothetical protein